MRKSEIMSSPHLMKGRRASIMPGMAMGPQAMRRASITAEHPFKYIVTVSSC